MTSRQVSITYKYNYSQKEGGNYYEPSIHCFLIVLDSARLYLFFKRSAEAATQLVSERPTKFRFCLFKYFGAGA